MTSGRDSSRSSDNGVAHRETKSLLSLGIEALSLLRPLYKQSSLDAHSRQAHVKLV